MDELQQWKKWFLKFVTSHRNNISGLKKVSFSGTVFVRLTPCNGKTGMSNTTGRRGIYTERWVNLRKTTQLIKMQTRHKRWAEQIKDEKKARTNKQRVKGKQIPFKEGTSEETSKANGCELQYNEWLWHASNDSRGEQANVQSGRLGRRGIGSEASQTNNTSKGRFRKAWRGSRRGRS